MTVAVGDSETADVGGTEAVTEAVTDGIFVSGRENTRLLRWKLDLWLCGEVLLGGLICT